METILSIPPQDVALILVTEKLSMLFGIKVSMVMITSVLDLGIAHNGYISRLNEKATNPITPIAFGIC